MQPAAVKDVARQPGFGGHQFVIEIQLMNQVENLGGILKAVGSALAQKVFDDAGLHDAADGIGRLDHGDETAGLGQAVGAGEPRKSGADDNDFFSSGVHAASKREELSVIRHLLERAQRNVSQSFNKLRIEVQ